MVTQRLWHRNLTIYLYLFPISGSNIWDSPTCFFLDALFMIMRQEAQQAWQCTIINYKLPKRIFFPLSSKKEEENGENFKISKMTQVAYLGLDIISSYNISNRTERRNENRWRRMTKWGTDRLACENNKKPEICEQWINTLTRGAQPIEGRHLPQ